MSRSEPIPGDQMTMDIYAPHVRGGPLHLINTTLNETVDPREQIYEADRHGIPLVLGPQSISVGIRHHARWNHKRPAGRSKGLPSKATDSDVRCAVAPGAPPNPDDDRFRVFSFHDCEPVSADRLDLGEWMAISGAAVATGMGLRTRLGPSLLLGLFNLRLGHWWDSGMDPMARARRSRPRGPSAKLEALLARLFPVYAFFLYELFGRFPGTANRHWYLTDGGHFENSGCYELIRRRLQFIVCCDNGADPDYLFADVANLVRLARIDFGAEIEFFDDAALTEFLSEDVRPYIGTLEELKSTAWRDLDAQQTGRSPHAALARIRYSKKQLGWKNAPEGGILLLIKPTVCGEEPLDVRGYRTAHSRFPQETTADQFFDEAQWEAYRRLGEHVGACLFGDGSREADRDKWYPAAARGAQLYRQVAQCVFSRAGRRSQAPSGR